MPTIRQRRVSAQPPAQPLYPSDDRIYTEEDYAIRDGQPETSAPLDPADYLTDDAFLPDEAEYPDDPGTEAYAPAPDAEYSRLFEEVFEDDPDMADDPLDEDLLTDEELAELKQSHWQLLSGLADFAGIILGVAVILVTVTLLVSLINWLVNDMSQSFILLQKHF